MYLRSAGRLTRDRPYTKPVYYPAHSVKGLLVSVPTCIRPAPPVPLSSLFIGCRLAECVYTQYHLKLDTRTACNPLSMIISYAEAQTRSELKTKTTAAPAPRMIEMATFDKHSLLPRSSAEVGCRARSINTAVGYHIAIQNCETARQAKNKSIDY
ncbi:hypothetical protein BaRGS_00012845 [Batillaria attramentaria]|uniref:Uncharacterized protein n=1 Tax=Batillaria attramentaria TaxID=370345 RepID=A0ABD0L978_9CAEN